MDRLPTEIVVRILNYLNTNDLFEATLVSTRWRDIINSHMINTPEKIRKRRADHAQHQLQSTHPDTEYTSPLKVNFPYRYRIRQPENVVQTLLTNYWLLLMHWYTTPIV